MPRPATCCASSRVDLAYRVDYGIVSNRHGRGVLAGEHAAARRRRATSPPWCRCWPASTATAAAASTPRTGRPLHFDLRPFLGLVGITPADGPAHSSTPPGLHGGNLDIRHLGLGSRLLLPVQVDGAGLYVGDPHFAQGNGEVALTAFEAPLRASLRVTVLDGRRGPPAGRAARRAVGRDGDPHHRGRAWATRSTRPCATACSGP